MANQTLITSFAEFGVQRIISEPASNYMLFDDDLKDSQHEQLVVFNNLEQGLPLYDGSSFKNQVHFQTAYQTPVQRWFPYREGYSLNLVRAFLAELKISRNVFDPFSGSGTTLLASRQYKLNSFGIDVNPISILVSKVENTHYDKRDVDALRSEINNLILLKQEHHTYVTNFPLAEKVFNYEILQAILQIKEYIKSIKQQKIQDIFFVAWLAIIEEVSNVKKEGNGIKYKNRRRTANGYINIDKDAWEKSTFPDDKFQYVKTILVQHLRMMLEDITKNYGDHNAVPSIYCGNCLQFDKFFSEEIQLTFFSPPYCNCFDYFEIHKVELWMGDFVKNQEEFKRLRNSGFRSNTNSLNHKPINYKNGYLETLISLLDINSLWSTRIPSVIRGYFDDMHILLSKLYKQTERGGFVGIVIGNSAYSEVIIPSDVIIADIALQLGYTVNNIFITRHLTTSSQQKKNLEPLKKYLRESIVLLKKN